MFWIIALILGGVCAAIANSKGRSAIGWFFLGFFFGVFGLIIVCCMSNLEAEQKKHQMLLDQQRRLKEKLKQEKLKNESFRQYTAERLDQHDDVLGIDTKTSNDLLASPSEQPPQLSKNTLKNWYFENEGQQIGPISQNDLVKLFNDQKINGETLLWKKDFDDWLPANKIQELIPHI